MKDYLFLPDRLKVVAAHIPQCETLADIGTDHAYIPIHAVKNGIAQFAIAADVVDGPLKIARENIEKYGLSGKVSTIKSNGLNNIPVTDVTVIAGMGGTLISEILHADLQKAHQTKLLILQPMTCSYELRKDLHKNGFEIIDESLAKDSGKLYNILCVKSGTQACYTEVEYRLGKYNIEKNPPLMREFLAYKIRVLQNRVSNMQNSKNPDILNQARQFENRICEYKKVGEQLGYGF